MAQPFDAVVLLAHGARDARWMAPFFRMRDALAPRLATATVAVAFMEFATPTFGEVVAELAQGGSKRVLVVPVFLSGGGHVAHDIPNVVGPVSLNHPGMTFSVSGALGEEPEVAVAMGDAVVRLSAG